MPDPSAIAWSHCPPDPLLWLQLREPLLQVLYRPWLALPLLGGLVWWLARGVSAPLRLALVAALLALSALLYSPIGTNALTTWLEEQIPTSTSSPGPLHPPAVAVVLGRGPQIAAASTRLASALLRDQDAAAVYVSGDAYTTAEALQRQGVASDQIAGDSCARTTWENATRTAAWLRIHHPLAPVLLITDPWQLPRATAAFRRQGLDVMPMAIDPHLTARQRNRLALRETAATWLYRLQGRL